MCCVPSTLQGTNPEFGSISDASVRGEVARMREHSLVTWFKDEQRKICTALEESTHGWRREVENLTAQIAQIRANFTATREIATNAGQEPDNVREIAQIRAQLAQTVEAASWAGREVSNLREEFSASREASSVEESQRQVQTFSTVKLSEADGAQKVRVASMDRSIEELQSLRNQVNEQLSFFNESLEACQHNLCDTNEFFAHIITAVSNDITGLHEGLGAMEEATRVLELRCGVNTCCQPSDNFFESWGQVPRDHPSMVRLLDSMNCSGGPFRPK